MMQFKRICGQMLVPLKAWRRLAAREKAALVRELSQVAELGRRRNGPRRAAMPH